MEYKMKSSEDFRRSVYAKKLAQDMKRQRRRRWVAGAASVLAAAVICFGLGLFSGKMVFTTGGPENGAPAPMLAAMHGEFDGEYSRQRVDTEGKVLPGPRNALDLRLVMNGAQTPGTVTVQLTNDSMETPLRLVSVRIVSSDAGDKTEQENLAGLVLQPGESQTVTLELGVADGSLLDAEFHYVMDGEDLSPLMKKTISLVWQAA